MVYQLIYTSRTRASIDKGVMEQIAYLASGRNDLVDVTGMLIFSKRVIVQVLEGPQDAVQEIYTKICRDTRHFEVSVLAEGEAPRREFPDTPMAFKPIDCQGKHSLIGALTDDTPLDFDTSQNRMFA